MTSPSRLVFIRCFIVLLVCMAATTLEGGFHPEIDDPAPKPSSTETPLLPSLFDPEVRIEVNIAALEMTVYEDNVPVHLYPIAIGSGYHPTPERESEIKRIEWNPWWYPPPYSSWAKNARPTPPGPGNPLGVVKLPLEGVDVLFHGTNNESSVGRAASHGCMRMKNADAAELGWYLQNLFSEQHDLSLRERYAKNRGTTYVVSLTKAIPVKLFYQPVVVSGESLILYPDHYQRVVRYAKERVWEELMVNGVDIGSLDESKIADLVRQWPNKSIATPIDELLLHPSAPQSTMASAHSLFDPSDQS